jgi:uncharacterized protein with LGFP repeats
MSSPSRVKNGGVPRWRGALGYPTSDEIQDGKFRRSNFQHGFIRWSEATGAVVTRSHNID